MAARRKLGGTGGADTAYVRAVLLAHQRLSADRALLRRAEDLGGLRHALAQLGDDIARLFQQVFPSDAHALFGHIILIVERYARHVRPAQPGGLSGLSVGDVADESQLARTAHRDLDLVHDDHALLGRIFVRDMPRGVLAARREIIPERHVVQLHHRAVNIEGQALAHVADIVDRIDDLLRGPAQPVVHHLNARRCQRVHSGRVPGHEGPRLAVLDVENQQSEPPFAGDGGIQLPQRARREVAGVGGGLFALLLHFLVVAEKGLVVHIDLSPELQILQRQIELGQHLRDGAGVERHVLAHPAVAAGLRHFQLEPSRGGAAPIAQRHAQSVDLGLHGEGTAGMPFVHLIHPGRDVLQPEHVLDGKHGHIVRHLHARLTFGRPADDPAGRVGRHPLGVLPLRGLKALHEPVVLVIRYLGLVLVIVPIHVVADRFLQFQIFLMIHCHRLPSG